MNVRNFPSWEELNKIMDGMIELGSKEKECEYPFFCRCEKGEQYWDSNS